MSFEFFELIQIEKLLSMVLALGVIQFIGGLASRKVGTRVGFIISGFINGLVSSTAFTTALAKKSKDLSLEQVRIESISFLSATLAMLLQGLFLVFIGIVDPPISSLLIFVGPILMTLVLILIRHRKTKLIKEKFSSVPLIDIISLIKLTLFIVGIITISKFLQVQFGGRGLGVLTFLVSLFEIHGSMIANSQLMVKNIISVDEFSFLLGLSICASYIGKIFIILVLGHPFLKKRVLLWTSFILISLALTLIY